MQNLHDASKITLKYSGIFRSRFQYTFDASSKYVSIIQCHFGRVENIQDVSKITLKYNSIFRRRVKNIHEAFSHINTLQDFSGALNAA